MCIKPVNAFEDSKGNMFKNERCAIESEIGIVTGMTADCVLTLIAKASPLVPLLQRALSIAPPPPKAEAPSPDAVRTPAVEEPVLTGTQLDEEGHHPECRARATGLKSKCNCNGPGKGLSK